MFHHCKSISITSLSTLWQIHLNWQLNLLTLSPKSSILSSYSSMPSSSKTTNWPFSTNCPRPTFQGKWNTPLRSPKSGVSSKKSTVFYQKFLIIMGNTKELSSDVYCRKLRWVAMRWARWEWAENRHTSAFGASPRRSRWNSSSFCLTPWITQQ